MMGIGVIGAILIQAFMLIQKILNHNVVAPFLTFAKGFEIAIIFIIAAAFLLVTVFVVLRQAKRLPKYYSIEVKDTFGQIATVDGLRLEFKTYEAAESYSRFYGQSYGKQYQFKV